MEEGFDIIFGKALVASAVQANKTGLSGIIERLCISFSKAHGLSEDVGKRIYLKIKAGSVLSATSGFGSGSSYSLYQSLLKDTLINNGIEDSRANIYALAVNAVAFGHTFNTNIKLKNVSKFIGYLLSEIMGSITNVADFRSNREGLIHPFTPEYLKSFLANTNYSVVYSEIQSSPKTAESVIVNYNWYDTSGLFAGPNLQKMKDCENQYYYLSGNITYPDIPQDLPECIEEEYQIKTLKGFKTVKYLMNYPCVNMDGLIGPRDSEFFRVFNDGPYSSGDFTNSVKQEFIKFDKEVLSGFEQQNNSTELFSYFRQQDGNFGTLLNPLAGDVLIDSAPRIDLTKEYEAAPEYCEGETPLQVMRVGGTGIRYVCSYFNNACYECLPTLRTGFRFAPIQLSAEKYRNRFSNIQTNPQVSIESMASRALNLESNVYKATPKSGKLQTFTYDYYSREEWYVGPPQFWHGNTLPYLAFSHEFENKTFGQFAKVTLYPSIGESNGSSSRNWSITVNKPITSGIDNSHYNVGASSGEAARVSFSATINSTGEFEETANKFFGMGDALDNKNKSYAYSGENAGYKYTGYYISGISGLVNTSSQRLVEEYENYIIGSRHKNTRFISGYTGINNLSISKMFASDSSDLRYEYYYFDNRLNPVSLPQTGWDSFAPLPELDASGHLYGRVYKEQNNENFFPRFYRGPYASIDKKFLYPNAESAIQRYGVTNGFPKRVRFTVKVREQAIKEIYSNILISNGLTSNKRERVNVIRPHATGLNLGQLRNLFDGSKNIYLDFNLWKANNYEFSDFIPTNLVDNDWSPPSYNFGIGSYWPIWTAGRSTSTYSKEPTFLQGILLTGNSYHDTYTLTGNGLNQGFIRAEPTPAAVGLYNYYRGKTFTGYMSYVKPVFSLESGVIAPQSLIEAIPLVGRHACQGGLVDARVRPFRGESFLAKAGQDPIYAEYVNGRKGGPKPELEGGSHSKGIVGDSWLYFTGKNYATTFCAWDINDCNRYRDAYNDIFLMLINSNHNQTTIHTRAAELTPFVFDYKKPPKFVSGSGIKNNMNIDFKYDSDGLYFDLGKVFPMKQRNSTGFYNSTGLILGPFDRDVEVLSKNDITGYTTIYLDDYIRADTFGCYEEGRQPCGYQSAPMSPSMIKVIPSGGMLKINVSSKYDCLHLEENHIYGEFLTGVGIKENSFIYIQPKGANLERRPIHTDRLEWDNFHRIQNGMEAQYTIDHSGGFEKIIGNHERVVFTRSGILYPKPDEEDFIRRRTTGQFGNFIYPTVQKYWELVTSTGAAVYASGWREGSRISFTFEAIELEYDDYPFETHRIVIPDGKCDISGEMAYYGQADNCVFTEGIHLVDNTPNQEVATGFYAPSFFSPVLTRLPMFKEPSGTTTQPVLEAPSTMIQREDKLKINYNQEYVKLNSSSPENYNKYQWPAYSDLKTLNPDETIEALPPDDGNTFLNNPMLICAAQGQKLADGTHNPDGRKVYDVRQQFQTYDSVATDALLNSGHFITARRGTQVRLRQPESGFLASKGATITNIKKGLA